MPFLVKNQLLRQSPLMTMNLMVMYLNGIEIFNLLKIL